MLREPDTAPFLVEIQEHAATFFRDAGHRGLELRAAVAARRMKHIAGQALRVHADQHVLAVLDVAAHERDVRFAVELIGEGEDAEGAVSTSAVRRWRRASRAARSASGTE